MHPHRSSALLALGSLLVSACAGRAAPSAPSADPLAVERELAASAPEHQPHFRDGALQLGEALIDETGLRLSAGAARIELGLAGWGRAGAMHEADEAPATITGPEARIARSATVTEWWRSLPSGLEHGVTLDERPAGEGELLLRLRLEGGVRATPADGGDVALRDASSDAVLARYGGLYVRDAEHRALPAVMLAAGDHIDIRVRDGGATYPVVVDPLLFAVQETTLRSSAPAEFAYFGAGVAMSAAGDRIAVGRGITSVIELFDRTGSSWAATPSITTTGTSRTDDVALALSAAGDRLLVGAPIGPSTPGTGRVFVRASDGTWSLEASLTDPTTCNGHQLGASAALDDSGSLAVLGATASCLVPPLSGEAFVFRRSGSAWALETVLGPPDTGVFESFGASVAVSSDGARILVGAPYALDDGAARVFVHDGSSWTLEGTLTSAISAGIGRRVAIDATGQRAIVTAPNSTVAGASGAGRAHVFVRDGSTWTEEAVLESATPTESDQLGSSVALSDDGSRAVLGAPSSGIGEVGSVTMFVRTGSTWSLAGRYTPADVVAGDVFGRTVAGDAGLGRLVVGAPSDDEPDGSGSARVVVWQAGRAEGEPCGASTECASDFCVDGVCCESACSGGTRDCQACSAALTGGADGACLPLSAAVAPTVVCRDAADVCDAAETCLAGAPVCPADGYVARGTECRAATADLCDVAEVCSGTSIACPADGVALAATTCRASTGACDPAERCDGSSPVCPADVLLPRDTECGGAMPRSCTTAGVCDGVTGTCGGGVGLPAGTPCAPADPENACDVEDVCDADGVCADRWAPASTACGSPGDGGSCDAPDHCAGMTGACIDAFLVDVECRASRGGCDLAETCSGDAPECPSDRLAAGGVVCRASVDASCDPAESCDGVSASCGPDENTCSAPDASTPDASIGTDAGARDAATADAGGPAVASGCHAGRGGGSAWAWLALAAVVVAWRRRAAAGGVGAGRRD